MVTPRGPMASRARSAAAHTEAKSVAQRPHVGATGPTSSSLARPSGNQLEHGHVAKSGHWPADA